MRSILLLLVVASGCRNFSLFGNAEDEDRRRQGGYLDDAGEALVCYLGETLVLTSELDVIEHLANGASLGACPEDGDSGNTEDTGSGTSEPPPCVDGPFVVENADGQSFIVQTRPYFSKAASSPEDSVTVGVHNDTLHLTIAADPCGTVWFTHVKIGVTCADGEGTGWWSNFTGEPERFRAHVQETFDSAAVSMVSNPGNYGFEAVMWFDFISPVEIPPGEHRTVVIQMDPDGASTSSPDWVASHVEPDIVWWGPEGEGAYPEQGYFEDVYDIDVDQLTCVDQ